MQLHVVKNTLFQRSRVVCCLHISSPCSFLLILFIISAHLRRSPHHVVTQTRGHKAGSSSAAIYGACLHFYWENGAVAHSSLIESRRILHTHTLLICPIYTVEKQTGTLVYIDTYRYLKNDYYY